MDVVGSNPIARSLMSRRCRGSGTAVVVLGVLVAALGCGGRRTEPVRAREPTAVGRVWNAGRHALGVALRHPEDVVEAPPPDAPGRPWIYCDEALAQHGVDAAAENAAALSNLASHTGGASATYDAIVVPGFTPLDATAPQRQIHPTAAARLELAQGDLARGLAPVILVSGGNVHPPDTPVNEAVQMKQWLVAHGTPANRVVVEPCARHSHTNLRNAGRFLLTNGLRRALIVTSRDQAMYFGQPRSSSFDGRCLSDLGYVVGELHAVDDHRVSFVPSGRTLDRGRDPLDP